VRANPTFTVYTTYILGMPNNAFRENIPNLQCLVNFPIIFKCLLYCNIDFYPMQVNVIAFSTINLVYTTR